MKRTLTVLFGIMVLFGFACTKHAAVTPPSTSHNPAPSQGAVANEKDVKITIKTINGACVILDPGDVYLEVGKDKIKWCVDYTCPNPGATVIIDDFKDSKGGSVTIRNPFGNHSDRDNAFDFAGSDCNKVTGLATIKGHYYYRIMVLRPDGSVLTSADPGVIIGD